MNYRNDILRAAAGAKNLNAAAITEGTELAYRTVRSVMDGQSINLASIKKVARFLGVDDSSLFSDPSKVPAVNATV